MATFLAALLLLLGFVGMGMTWFGRAETVLEQLLLMLTAIAFFAAAGVLGAFQDRK